ncbi:hypothetical protein EDD18DRAFT_688764 [Armillaria luteobubalina]|uniref:Uncharacterized protein n=1 Tax=Armillaria luteobubalina TaxID=153913 RepID=A0AA39QHF0_9AGAR|nr:hypothetical protein EDD18DRAFT_688764 [Armillaria luteobubalina]
MPHDSSPFVAARCAHRRKKHFSIFPFFPFPSLFLLFFTLPSTRSRPRRISRPQLAAQGFRLSYYGLPPLRNGDDPLFCHLDDDESNGSSLLKSSSVLVVDIRAPVARYGRQTGEIRRVLVSQRTIGDGGQYFMLHVGVGSHPSPDIIPFSPVR